MVHVDPLSSIEAAGGADGAFMTMFVSALRCSQTSVGFLLHQFNSRKKACFQCVVQLQVWYSLEVVLGGPTSSGQADVSRAPS